MRLAAPALLLAAALPAQAALWGYVDAAGVAHVAVRQVDSHYRLVLGDAADTHVAGKTDEVGGVLTWLEIAPEVHSVQHLLREAAQSTGVDMELLKAVIAVESGFDAKAVSPKGALGLMQLTPAAAARYAPRGDVRSLRQRLTEPRTNILIGARMLADLTRRFGRIDLALAAYNAGEGAVRKAGGLPPIDETVSHVQMVLELYWALLQRRLPSRAQEVRVDEVATAASAASAPPQSQSP